MSAQSWRVALGKAENQAARMAADRGTRVQRMFQLPSLRLMLAGLPEPDASGATLWRAPRTVNDPAACRAAAALTACGRLSSLGASRPEARMSTTLVKNGT